ncbi:MBOA5-like protein [Mya arenaria]|uniref:Lysophospholipid acyltransferase 5 n=1 Tax=Mya arenaria TaxID=6604 RepID=A0ABY7EZG2_MYAAR|nr:MBOA5-like protein [Mya arenaria]
MDQQSEGIVYKLAESLGSADAAVRLILSLLAGLTTVHSLANTVLVWLLIRLLGGSASGVVAAFILNNSELSVDQKKTAFLYEAGKRLLAGVWYIATFQAMSSLFFTDQYMLSQQFHNLSFLAKCAYILVWGKLNISKYVGVWLIGEGSCILTGLTYNGKDKNGNVLWDGCSNAHIYTFESSATFRELISGFNVNTNNWMARYIFKRLRFLGNVQISQVVTLLYLAVWHGLHSGYYMNFFLEFIMINGETQLAGVIRQFPGLQAILSGALLRPLVWFVKKTLLLFFVGYALVSFVHLKWSRYSQVYGSVYYVGHVIFLVLPFLCLLVRLLVRSPSKRDTNGASVKEPADDKKTS